MPSRLFEGLAIDPYFLKEGRLRFLYYEKLQGAESEYGRTRVTDGLPKPEVQTMAIIFEDISLVPKRLYKW